VTDYVSRVVKPALQTVPGVADVEVDGDRRYAMRVWLEPERLAAYKLTVQDVEDALRRQNLEVPAGRIESTQREFTVVSQTDLQRAQEFEAVVVRTVNGFPVRIRDVAKVGIAPRNERSVVRLNGRNAISVGLIKQATANPLTLADALRTELPSIQRDLPPGVELRIANDNTVFIDRAVKAVYTTIAEAVLLVVLVIFLFLHSVRASVIPLVTIPVCAHRPPSR
jgi:multidrug efflux pump